MAKLLDRCEGWVQGKFAQLKTFRGKYPAFSLLIILLFGYVLGGFHPINTLIDWRHAERTKVAVRQTDFNFRINLLAELERNIRVLQFYVWGLKNKWSSDFYTTQTAVRPYVNFVTSQSSILADVYQNAYLGEVSRLYQEFDVANQKIQAINTEFQPAAVLDQDADYFRSLINKSVGLYKRIAAGMGDTTRQGKSYLTDAWESEGVLANNCREFMEIENRKIATRSIAVPK